MLLFIACLLMIRRFPYAPILREVTATVRSCEIEEAREPQRIGRCMDLV